MNSHWVNFLRIKKISDRTTRIKHRVVQNLHKNSWMSIKGPKKLIFNFFNLLCFIIISWKFATDQGEHELVTSFLNITHVAKKGLHRVTWVATLCRKLDIWVG